MLRDWSILVYNCHNAGKRGNDMNNLWIKYFRAVVENDMNFTKASQAVYVSQPALSKHISDLGKELGVKLFDTSRKNAVQFTAGGKLLYQFFTECDNRLKKTVMAAKKLNDQKTGELRIAVANDWNILDLHKKIDNFSSKYPRISIIVDSLGFNDIKKGLIARSYDMVVTSSNQFAGISNLNSKKITSAPLVVLLASNHRLAKKERIGIVDFKNEVLYTLSPDADPLAAIINAQYCKAKGSMPKIITHPNLDTILLAVSGGKGFAIVPKSSRIIKNTDFKYFELDDFIIICVVWRKDNNNAALSLFCSECLEEKICSSA
jgi:DNA-binding transcriptional LysR family regulator